MAARLAFVAIWARKTAELHVAEFDSRDVPARSRSLGVELGGRRVDEWRWAQA
jgi:hypothetical protein